MMLPGDAALNLCTVPCLAVNSRRDRASTDSLLVKSNGHCLLFSVAGATANRETLLFDFTAIKTVAGPAKCPGKNQDAMIETGFQAVMHATLGCT
jgi:hypothetical protein